LDFRPRWSSAHLRGHGHCHHCKDRPNGNLSDFPLDQILLLGSSCHRAMPQRYSAIGLVLEPKLFFSMPYLSRMANSMLDVLSVLSGNTMWRFPLNLPSIPPRRMTGTFTCAWRWEFPMLLPL